MCELELNCLGEMCLLNRDSNTLCQRIKRKRKERRSVLIHEHFRVLFCCLHEKTWFVSSKDAVFLLSFFSHVPLKQWTGNSDVLWPIVLTWASAKKTFLPGEIVPIFRFNISFYLGYKKIVNFCAADSLSFRFNKAVTSNRLIINPWIQSFLIVLLSFFFT